jgi:hypothetical protein
MKGQTAIRSKGCTHEDIKRVAAWQDKQVPVGGVGKFLVTMNGYPFASFDTDAEMKAAHKMYAEQERNGSTKTCNFGMSIR